MCGCDRSMGYVCAHHAEERQIVRQLEINGSMEAQCDELRSARIHAAARSRDAMPALEQIDGREIAGEDEWKGLAAFIPFVLLSANLAALDGPDF